MKSALCKFTCEKASNDGGTVRMTAVTEDGGASAPEDNAFTRYTPWGELEFALDNPALEGFFEPGADYYIEIRRAESEAEEAVPELDGQ